MLGFAAEALVEFVPFDDAAAIRNKEVTREEWGEAKSLTREAVLDVMRDYMTFAWDKAQNHRGISASRSVTKMQAWIWLMDDPDITAPYQNYGAPFLRSACERYGFPIPASDDVRRMAQGEPCREGCDEGCGQ